MNPMDLLWLACYRDIIYAEDGEHLPPLFDTPEGYARELWEFLTYDDEQVFLLAAVILDGIEPHPAYDIAGRVN